ncbi:MAG TPA: hypothetical protein VJ047_16520 [Pseudomonas sp.]|nr:hypothetical protein [Pseudomonas sp.]
MPRLLTVCLLCLMPTLLLAAELDGRYLATLDGLPAEMILHSQGQQVKGQYMENNRLRLIISGSFDGQLLRAQINDPQSGQLIANMHANYANAMLNARIVARSPHNGAVLQREALFQRQVSNAAPAATPPQDQAPAEERDPALIGTWVHEQLGDDESLASLLTLQLGADGSITQWTRNAADDSANSPDSPGTLQYRGRWQSSKGLLLVQLQDREDYQPAAFYRVNEPHLVTESNTGKMLWKKP